MLLQEKYKWLILILVGLASVGVIYLYSLQIPEPNPKYFLAKKVEKKARLILDYGNGQQRWFEGKVVKGMTVFDALNAAALAGDFKVYTSLTGEIERINGLENKNGQKWCCYFKDNQKITNITERPIKPGQEIICRYK